MSTLFHNPSRQRFLTVLPFLFAAICFAPRLAQLWSAHEPTANASVLSQTVDEARVNEPEFLTKPIEEIRPGDRVLAHNPEVTDAERASAVEPDPATWRLIELAATDEHGHKVEVRLLRPLKWIQAHSQDGGRSVNLSVEELSIDGQAAVLSISPCPPLKPGRGQVVTGTFRHYSDQLVAVHIEGQPTPLICTSGHPFWSEDRQTYLAAISLRPRERLRVADGGIVPVDAVRRTEGEEHVFNLEVLSDHVYYVGGSGVLVHNATDCIADEFDDEYIPTNDGRRRTVQEDLLAEGFQLNGDSRRQQRADQLAINKQRGDAFRDELKAKFEADPNVSRVDIEQTMMTDMGARRMDLVVHYKDGTRRFIEAKVGSSPYTWAQRIKDRLLQEATRIEVEVFWSPF